MRAAESSESVKERHHFQGRTARQGRRSFSTFVREERKEEKGGRKEVRGHEIK